MWSSCSNLCGNGTQRRHRECSNPEPANNGQKCVGNSTQIRGCVNTSCPGRFPNNPYIQSHLRLRKCFLSMISYLLSFQCALFHPGLHGLAILVESSDNQRQILLIDFLTIGSVSEWSEWTSCNVTCGNGSQSRFRNCTNPPPINGVRSCKEKTLEYRTCQLKQCEGNIILSDPLN